MTGKWILLAGASLSVAVAPAMAQEVTNATSEGGLADIVVTAQKREQNLQSVPVSVTALTAESIANQRIADFSDLTRAASSLTITQQTTSPNNSIVLRGIGTFAFSIGVEPSVAVIIDDMPVVQQAQAFDNLSDVERIEVLKGPQGTLFGKSASAGVVNIVTKDPGNIFSGSASVTAATDSDYRAEATISTPLGENAGLRVTGFYHEFAGNVRNLTTGEKLNDQKNYGVRAKLKLHASDNLKFTVTGGYSKATQDGASTTIRNINPLGTPQLFGLSSLALVPSLTGITPGAGNYRARVDTAGATRNETASVAVKADLDIGFANLIAVTAYQDWKYRFEQDVDGTDLDLLGALTSGAAHGGLVQRGPYHSTSLTQELRLVSIGSDALKYVVGGYYSDAKTSRHFERGPNLLLASWNGASKSKSAALFAQLDYHLSTGTNLSGGVRYNHEKVGVSFDNLLANATANSCATGNPLCRGSNSDNVVTWKGSISQEIAPKVLAYASIAKGYKGYAYDVSSGFNPARINAALAGTASGLNGVGPIKAENSTSYELGLKSRFLDNRVQLNVVGFLTNYNNFQAQSSVVVNNAVQLVLNNVGKLRTKGVEVELSAKPNDWLRIDASAAYTDAVIRSFKGAQSYAGQIGATYANGVSSLIGNCTTAPAASAGTPTTLCQFQNRSGSRLPNSPKFKYTVGATGEFPFGDDNKAIATLNYQRQSHINFDLLGSPQLDQKAYGIFNASLGAQLGQYRVTAFVNNLFDTNYAAYLTDNFSTMGGSATNPANTVYQFHPRDSQRYFGLRLGVQF